MNSSIRKYTYDYDTLSRLTSATYQGTTPAEKYNTAYTYDKHGNIETLQRYGKTTSGAYGLVDSLTLHYTGNQLINVTDSVTTVALAESNDFKKGSTTNPGYTYNKNGAMIQDLNKKISNISYNSLDLPKELTFVSQPQSLVTTIGGVQFTLSSGGKALTSGGSTRTHTYTYAADGRKLRVVQGDTSCDYVGNIIYENGSLKRILVDGGYIEGGMYYFNFNDHLGNIRAVATQTGTTYQKNDYYPFGLPMAETSDTDQNKQPYKYNGKEFDRTDGLNWMDYGARQYDAAIGRFTTVDQHAESYYSWSPYHYGGNNPILNIDPFGMDYWSTNDPREIERFLYILSAPPTAAGSSFEEFNFSSWNHSTDEEFVGNLYFNDKTNTFYSSYGEVDSNGEFNRVGVSIEVKNVFDGKALVDGPRNRWLSKSSGAIKNVHPEAIFFGSWTQAGGRALRYLARQMFAPSGTVNTFNANKSGFVSGGRKKEKMGRAQGNMPGSHVVQNKQVSSLVNKYKLNKTQRDELHRLIGGEGYGYHEIEQLIKEYFLK